MEKMRIYTEDGWVDDRCNLLPLARSLLHVRPEPHMGTFRDRFLRELDFDDVCERVSCAEDSDFLLLPLFYNNQLNHTHSDKMRHFEDLSVSYDKPILLHGLGKDLLNSGELEIVFSNAWYLSPCLIRNPRLHRCLALPYFVPDCRAKYFPYCNPLLPKPVKPTVGFCGVAAPLRTAISVTKIYDCLRLALTYATELGIDPEGLARLGKTNLKHAFRTRLILDFQRNKNIETDFILRPVGGLVNNAFTNSSDFDDFNTTFYNNMHHNLYNICCRGTENYSIRFYETLCMGRIPIVVDSDLVLPFDRSINYKQSCVWIEKKELYRADEILLDFHQTKSPECLFEIQISNRRIWENFLNHKAYYRSLSTYISTNSNNNLV